MNGRSIEHARAVGARVERSEGFATLARAGVAGRGVIYAIVGVLAIELALGVGGTTTNQRGALEALARQPFGGVLLALVGVTLAGYAALQLLRALVGGNGQRSRDGAVERLGALGSGLVHAGLCVLAFSVLANGGGGGGGGSGSPSNAAAGVFSWPAGTWLVGIVGAIVVGIGLYQGYRAVTDDFLKDYETGRMGPTARTLVVWTGRVGYLARIVVFGMIGVFLIVAAVDFDPRQAVGLDGALAKLAHAAAGPLLLGIVAAGLIVFAAHCIVAARYRRI